MVSFEVEVEGIQHDWAELGGATAGVFEHGETGGEQEDAHSGEGLSLAMQDR